jgi:hypothetical protein
MAFACAASVGALHIEGNTFPVDQFYLEDLVEARLRAAVAEQRRQLERRKQRETGDESGNDKGSSSSSSGGGGGGGSSTGVLPFLAAQQPAESQLASLAAAAAGLKYAPVDAMIGVDRFSPGRDYELKGKARQAVLDYKVG